MTLVILVYYNLWHCFHQFVLLWMQKSWEPFHTLLPLWGFNFKSLISTQTNVFVKLYLSGDQRRRPLRFRWPARWLQPDSPSDPHQDRAEKWRRELEAVTVPSFSKHAGGLSDELTTLHNQDSLTVSLSILHQRHQHWLNTLSNLPDTI